MAGYYSPEYIEGRRKACRVILGLGIGAVLGEGIAFALAEVVLTKALAAKKDVDLEYLIRERVDSDENTLLWGSLSESIKKSVIRLDITTSKGSGSLTATIVDLNVQKDGFEGAMLTTKHGLNNKGIIEKITISNWIFPGGVKIASKNFIVMENPQLDLIVIAFRGAGGFPFSSIGMENIGGELDLGDSYTVVSYPGFLKPDSVLVQKAINLHLPSKDGFENSALSPNPIVPNFFPILSSPGSSGGPVFIDQRLIGVLSRTFSHNLSSTFQRIREDDSNRIINILSTATMDLAKSP